MRPLLFVLFAIVTVFGSVRLINEFRGKQAGVNAPAGATLSPPRASQPVVSAAPQASSAVSLGAPPPVKLVPVSLQPSQAPQGAANRAAAIPASEEDLISAIQKELSRLGYYDGPATGRWSKAIRHAVRLFIRRTGEHPRRVLPTIELLTALQAADPKNAQGSNRRASTLPEPQSLQSAGLSPKDPPAKERAPASEAASKDDDYLPPWMTSKARRAAGADSTEPQGFSAQAPASASEIEGQIYQKRHARASRERRARASYGGYAPRRGGHIFFLPF
ncbi:MAG: putative peptidoglycan binding domain-containing protein [Rhodomicrobium sp.]